MDRTLTRERLSDTQESDLQEQVCEEEAEVPEESPGEGPVYSAPVWMAAAAAGLPPSPNGNGGSRPASFFQKSYGNIATLRLNRYGPSLQAKPRGTVTGDPRETEADRFVDYLESGSAEPQSLSSLELRIQRAPGDSEAASPAPASPQTTPAPDLIVDDTEAAPGPGQMRKSEFLGLLQSEVCRTANETLAGTMWSALGCPWISHWFSYYSGRDSRDIERAIRRYAPETATGVSAARDYIPLICSRVRRGIETWSTTGEVTGVPAEVQGPGGPEGGGGVLAGAADVPTQLLGGIFFKGRDGGARGPGDARSVQARLRSGRPLEGGVKSRMESAYGADFSAVRVHTDANAAGLSDRLNARAFTVGRDVAFASGEYRPGTPIGDALIAHELAHVVQQGGGSRAAPMEKGETGYGSLEEDADRSAIGAVVSLWGGPEGTLGRLRHTALPRLRSGLRLQRCGGPATARDPFIDGLMAKIKRGDSNGVLDDIRGLNGSRAGDGRLRAALNLFLRYGRLTAAQAFRAVALQELGPERSWPDVVTNFAQGLDTGTFTMARELAPAGADALREFCVFAAGEAAEGRFSTSAPPKPAALKAHYRNRFNSVWDIAPYNTFTTTFDNTMSSKGPRNRRAREIFDHIYGTVPLIKRAYDANWDRFREMCDLYGGPDATNLIASPRLQELRVLFNGSAVTASGTADPAYQAFVAVVTPKAQALLPADRAEVRQSNQWRLVIEQKVQGPTPAVTQALYEDLRTVILTSAPSAPAAGPAPAPALPPPEPVSTPNAAQTQFLNTVNISVPQPQVTSDTAATDLPFNVQSTRPNPGLIVRRRVVVEPVSKVRSGEDDQTAWPNAGTSVPHTARVETDAGAAGYTDFTSRLTMLPLPPGTFTEKTATVRLVDNRQAWFIANVQHGLIYVQENQPYLWASGAGLRYHGGQLPLTISPRLPAPNPGLTVYMRGELKQNGTSKATYNPIRFAAAESTRLGSTIVLAGTPPSTSADNMDLRIEFFSSAAMTGAPMHTITQAFQIAPALPPVVSDASLMSTDNGILNQPETTAGSLLHYLKNNFAAGSLQHRVADAVAGNAIKVQACIVRSDSATWLTGPPVRGNPANQVAYACGGVDDAHTLVDRPNAVGWHWGSYQDTVFLNLTPDSHAPGAKRPPSALADFFVHESIHAADLPARNTWEQYQMEFRAYWIQGMAAAESTAYDPTIPYDIGPKSERANTIFRSLYRSTLYDWVKPAYDANVDHFRERADGYLYPDAINLTFSTHLADLRREIESYTGSGYAAKKAAVQTKFAVCNADDKREISGNWAWRDLVEQKFTGSVWVGWLTWEDEALQIKRILGIPA